MRAPWPTPSKPCDPGPVSHALLRANVALPFLLVALIWGSTWYIITGQIAAAPPTWSIAWRFMLATPAMFAVALAMRGRLMMGGRAHLLAGFIGLSQFCGNFNFVYRAELHLTSGVVAVLFVLIIVSNAVFGRIFLGERVGRRFWEASAIAFAGMILLLVHELRAGLPGGNVPLGALFALGAVLTASIANVVQANPTGRAVAMPVLLAWSMLYGTAINIVLALAVEGLPAVPVTVGFWAGLGWLALAGSVVTFPLYYGLIRRIGAGRAAYQNVLVIVVAMVISTVLEGYDWSLLAVSGAGLALLGTWLALRAREAVASPRPSSKLR